MPQKTQPATKSRPSPPARFAGLDGLRAIAVTTVILFHLTPGALPGGYLGVDIFFVISGFLITALLIREHDKNGRIRLADFWRRRARRLLPALVVLVLACCSLALVAGGNVLVGLGRQVLGAATFSSNWLSIASGSSYFTEANPELFRNLWSLAVEEQFYLVWPLALLALLLVRSTAIRCAVLGVLAAVSIAAMWFLYSPGGDATRVYYGTDTHSFGLAIGAILAFANARWWPWPLAWPRWSRIALPTVGAIAVAGLLVASVILPADADVTYQGGLAVVALLTAVAIGGATMPASALGRVLDVAPLRWVGERSYGLYLWHWPAFVLAAAFLPSLSLDGGGGWILGGIALIATLLAATLSYRYIEQPIRRNGFRHTLRHWFWSRRREARAPAPGWRATVTRVVASALAACLVLLAGAASVMAITLDPGETDAETIIDAGSAIASPPAPIPTPATPIESAPVAIPAGDQITAIGDSVMLASAPELAQAFPGISINAVVSRQLVQAPAILSSLKKKGKLRPTILLGLGTNGPIEPKVLDQIRMLAGTDHHIVVVNVQAPRGWTPGVNAALAAFALRYRNVELANWHNAIAGKLSLLARDQIHPGPSGGALYAKTVKDALQRLAELPPLLSANDYGLAPRPS
ncbi:peptidoglycan/LPS O-acetylase OafA/YrhL [Cryobacterium mesophilum]|nr:acyltransferase family protein [Terrimesophilobacter mesophilus]MBB5632898.1 peptidoglycan/LPS O-acetylase OafA/YrhL [Terrimesophilobacter mesophilus]